MMDGHTLSLIAWAFRRLERGGGTRAGAQEFVSHTADVPVELDRMTALRTRSGGWGAGERTASAILLLAVGLSAHASAQSLEYSPDVSVSLSGVAVLDEEVAVDNLLGLVVPEALGGLPDAVDVDAYQRLSNGDRLFSLDIGAGLPGPLNVERSDVIRWDDTIYTLEFDASAEGLPASVNVDAVAVDGTDLLLSFDTTVDLGGGLVAADEDLVRFDGVSFSMAFDASGTGIDPALDLDGAAIGSLGAYLVSFDTTGEVSGWWFDDDTVMRYNGSTWTPLFETDFLHPGFEGGDIIALPEPGAWLGLGSCLTMLAGLARWKRG